MLLPVLLQDTIQKLTPKIISFTSFTHHSFLQSVNFHSSRYIYTCNVQISALSRAGQTKAARKLFDEMPNRDVVSWNAMITGYWQNGFLKESKILFDSMPLRNVVSWNSMISCAIENDGIDDAYVYFCQMPEKNVASWNAMISGFVKYDRVEEASVLFEEMPKKNVISYTAMLDGYVRKRELERARALFDCMPFKNTVSWTVMISGYVENERFVEAEELFVRMPEKNVVAITAMMTGYCREGRMVDAKTLFEGIQCKDCVSFNAMIAGYSQDGNGEEALKLYINMLRSGLIPDHFTFISVLTACSSLASLNAGKQTHALLLKYRLESHVSACNSLITMYSKSGSIHDSELAFKHIENPNIVSYNTIVAAFAQHGLYEKALTFFKKLEINGFQPDERTFLSMISACGHAGMVKESLYWFGSMTKKYNVTPTPEHYACLVDILGRSGQVEKAYEMIKEMPFEADAGVWGALLAGCRSCLNVELGEKAAKKMGELDPRNGGSYVMLSNIYAGRGLWKEVTRVRSLMKDKWIKKQPAYSWMEIDNVVEYFLGGDVSHSAIEEIHSEVKQMNLQMKEMDDIAEEVHAWN